MLLLMADILFESVLKQRARKALLGARLRTDEYSPTTLRKVTYTLTYTGDDIVRYWLQNRKVIEKI